MDGNRGSRPLPPGKSQVAIGSLKHTGADPAQDAIGPLPPSKKKDSLALNFLDPCMKVISLLGTCCVSNFGCFRFYFVFLPTVLIRLNMLQEINII